MSTSKFTFCIPNLNKIKYLPACIESMLAQDCPNWRCVFVDGYSTDGSWEYMQQFASDSRFELVRGLKQGMYADWNECLKYVNTEYFYFLTSDDTCYPGLVSKTTNALDKHPDIDACHFQFVLIDAAGKTIKSPDEVIDFYYSIYNEVNQVTHIRSGVCEFVLHFVYRTIYTTITSLVFRKSLISKLGGFTTQFGSIGDFDWTMRLTMHTDILYIPELLATWRIYSEQATQSSNYLEDLRKVLDVGRSNLNVFEKTAQAKSLKKRLEHHQLLTEFESHYAAGLYKKILSSKGTLATFQHLYIAASHFPIYPFKKLINRLTMNQLYDYKSRLQLAYELIEAYGLQWPPQPELISDFHKE